LLISTVGAVHEDQVRSVDLIPTAYAATITTRDLIMIRNSVAAATDAEPCSSVLGAGVIVEDASTYIHTDTYTLHAMVCDTNLTRGWTEGSVSSNHVGTELPLVLMKEIHFFSGSLVPLLLSFVSWRTYPRIGSLTLVYRNKYLRMCSVDAFIHFQIQVEPSNLFVRNACIRSLHSVCSQRDDKINSLYSVEIIDIAVCHQIVQIVCSAVFSTTLLMA
jgi:hypothetical protein